MGARRGDQYIAGLNDDREVWYGSERINVATDPRFKGSVEGMAAYFDYQWQHEDDCLFNSPSSGEKISVSHLRPRNDEDIRRRHRAFDRFARYSMGMLGRTPDYVNVVLAGHVSRVDLWEQASDLKYYERISQYQKYVAENDLALTHTIVHANIDKSIGELDGANADLTLQVVDRREDGVIVRGAKLLATLGPIADECYVYPATPIKPGYEQYAISFATPMNAPGVVVVCRDHYGVDQPVEDRPFSSRFDEQDGVVIFDNVFIPNDRIFIDGELDLYNAVNQGTATGGTQHQTSIRAAVKLEFAYDLLAKMADTMGAGSRPDIATMLGEVHGYFRIAKAVIHSAETRAHDWGGGAFFIHDDIGVLRTVMPEWMTRVNEIIKTIGSHNLLATPTQSAFEDPRLGPLLERYLPGAKDISAPERAQIFRTAWDFAGSALGSRIDLYERFYLGSIGRARILEHMKAQRKGEGGQLKEFLEQSDRVSEGNVEWDQVSQMS